MLSGILRVFGIDLERKVQLLKGQVHDAVEETSSRFRHELQGAGLFIIIAGLGAVALATAVGMGAAALFIWLDQQYGVFVGLGAVGGISAIFAAIIFVFAFARTSKVPTHRAPPEKAAPPQSEAASAVPHSAQPAQPARPATIRLSTPPLSPDASLVDQLTHRFGQRALEASDEAIERAEALMREGSSGSLLTALALAAAVGLVIGRRGGFQQ